MKKQTKVTVPRRVIKKEAQKLMKDMQRKEREKDRRAAVRDRAKAKATRARTLQKARDAADDDHWGDLRHELYGGLWIGLGVILYGFLFSGQGFGELVQRAMQFLFGAVSWGVPAAFLGWGVYLFRQPKDYVTPPVQVLGLLLFAVCIMGLVNLALPLSESHAQMERFGGAVGFTVGFFFREFMGDLVATLVLLFGVWWGAVLGFGVRIGHVLVTFREALQAPVAVVSAGTKAVTRAVKTEASTQKEKEVVPPKHFHNELKIIDQSRPDVPENPLTQAKNKKTEGVWEPPGLDLLKEIPPETVVDEEQLRTQAELIREKLSQFNIEVGMRSVHVGPTVTQFTLEPAAGVKLTKITALKNDLALALAASTVRIEAPIRGKSLVGIEIPNEKRAVVGMKEIVLSEAWNKSKAPLKLAVGRDVAGKPAVVDLAKMPHLLIAGKTGSGKSVAMNAFLVSLLWNNSPEDLKLILVDPKRVELSLYNHLPHLLTQVIVEPEKCVSALAWAVAEMNRRYKAFAEEKVRNIVEWNEKFKKDTARKEPYIVIVIDELADLMMVAGKDVEAAICRIAQMARAVGMHLMIATQRPSVDVVTGLIKANLPSRFAFKVSSGIDSRTIIDQIGAEDLLGFGDMLALDGNSGAITRLQGVYISNEEIERVVRHIRLQFPESIIDDSITKADISGMAKGGVLTAGTTSTSDADLDEKYHEAVTIVLQNKKASASFLQRRMEIGYARAARILDQMEHRGIIGPSRGAKPREIYGMNR